jgi:hypothetical protein
MTYAAKRKLLGGKTVELLVNGNQLGLIVLPARIKRSHPVDIVHHLGLKLTNAGTKREFTASAGILGKAAGQSLDLVDNVGSVRVVDKDIIG